MDDGTIHTASATTEDADSRNGDSGTAPAFSTLTAEQFDRITLLLERMKAAIGIVSFVIDIGQRNELSALAKLESLGVDITEVIIPCGGSSHDARDVDTLLAHTIGDIGEILGLMDDFAKRV